MTKRLEYINPEEGCSAQGFYSHVTRVLSGTPLLIAGQLSVDKNGDIAGEHDFGRQF